eukprot:g12865.t1
MGNVWQKSYIDVHEATQSGHIDEVRRWVDAGKPVDARDNTQKTPLHHAAQWGQEEALDFLIECGADVDAADFIEDTPLHLACYFGHANCARILIMVGADIGAKDCYGNTPSQIFDDHVTEPVVDEIRYIVRQVIRGPPPAQESEHETPGPASVFNRDTSCGGPFHNSTSSPTAPHCTPSMTRKDSGLLSHEGKHMESENVVPAPGADGAGVASKTVGSKEIPDSMEMIANFEVKRSEPLDAGQSLAVGDEQEGKSDRPRIRVAGRSSVGFSVQQKPQEAGQEAPHGRIDGGIISREEDGATDEKEARPHPSRATTARGKGVPETDGLAPALKLSLPWQNEEGGPGQASTRKIGCELAKSPAAGASRGGMSARTVGAGGSAAAGLTHPGPRPLSAPPIRRSISTSPLNATSPALSGRRFEGTSVDLGGSRSLGCTAGVSLAGRLLSYATMPGGTFDVFAAARDGQVSVLKQALTEGEHVDVPDEAGLTALMWAARTGRLSTAQYLVSQGASLERRDEATGFSPLHFAAYYCRSSVVRVLVLAGADTKATDNRGRIPGACFQPLSYLSYEAFQHRRLIRRFLAGDLKDGMDDKGKTMFPMNSPLEAYDEEHRPQCVRLGSRDNLSVHSSENSAEEGLITPSLGSGSAANQPRSRSRANAYNPKTSHRRASAEIARKAYATMHTMHSKIDEDSFTQERPVTGAARSRRARSAAGGGGGGGGGDGGVRYYLRRGSIQQVAAKTKKILAGVSTGGSGSGSDNENDSSAGSSRRARSQKRTRSFSRPGSTRAAGGAEGGVNFYLRRSSLHRLPVIDNLLSGGAAKEGEDNATGGAFGAVGDGDDDQGAGMARDMAVAVACSEAAAAATAGGITAGNRDASGENGDCTEQDLSSVEAGNGAIRRGNELASRGQGEAVEGGEKGAGGRRISARLMEGIRDGAKDWAAQIQGGWEPSGNRRPSRDSPRSELSPVHENIDIESGTRTMPPTQGEASPVVDPGLDQEGVGPQPSQQREPRESAAAPPRRHPETGVVAELACGGAGGDASRLAQPHGGRDNGSVAKEKASASEGSTLATAAEVLPHKDSANDGEATAAAELDPPNHGDHTVDKGGIGGAVCVLGTPRAAEGGLGVVGDAVSATNDCGEPTIRPGRSRAPAVEGAVRGAGMGTIPPVERGSQPGEALDAAEEEHEQTQRQSNLEGRGPVQGDDQRVLHPHEPNRQLKASSAGLDAEPPRDEPAATAVETPAEHGSSSINPHRHRETQPSDVFFVGSMPSSVGDNERGDGGTDGGTDAAGPRLSGDESTRNKHRSDRSSGRRSHKHKHKRSHRHRGKSSDEGGGKKSRRRRSRDDGILGSSTSASTITTLAPLKRIPPPSLSSAQRTISQGDGPPAEEARSGADVGGSGGGGDG